MLLWQTNAVLQPHFPFEKIAWQDFEHKDTLMISVLHDFMKEKLNMADLTSKIQILLSIFISSLAGMIYGQPQELFNEPGSAGAAPRGWYFHAADSFKPNPKIAFAGLADGSQVMHVSEISGKSGFSLCRSRTFPVTGGDILVFEAEIRGQGLACFQLEVFSKEDWLGGLSEVCRDIPSQWGKITVELPVSDISRPNPSTRAMLRVGAKKDSEVFFKHATITVRKKEQFHGTAAFPRQWKVFLPVDETFVPAFEQLSKLPEELGGVPGRLLLYDGNEFDLANMFGAQKARNCAWLFAELKVPEACTYSIAAGADWWMHFFINGQSVFDTLETGNILHPPRLKDHIFHVQLQKGSNIIAVKFLSGANSSKIVFGGPRELQMHDVKFRLTEILAEDNFEDPRQERSGNPQIIQGNPTPGLLILTGQGVYNAKLKPRVALKRERFFLPRLATNQYFAGGLRIQSFGRDKRLDSNLRLVFQVVENGDSCLLEFEHRAEEDSISCILRDRQQVVKTFTLPYSLLPADFLVASDAAGNMSISISSLAESSYQTIDAKVPLFAEFSDKEFAFFGEFSAAEELSAELVIDNLLMGFAVQEAADNLIPVNIKVQPEFDPRQAGWKLAFADEFNGKEIDWNKWQCSENAKTNLSLSGDGFLQVAPSRDEKGKLTAGSLRTREKFKYGYFEARLRFTKEPGWWSFFYLYGDSVGNSMIDGMEIDIYEDYYFGNKRPGSSEQKKLDHNLHMIVGGIFKSWNYLSYIPGRLDDFYTIGCKWTPLEISYYLDGKLISSSANHSPHKSVTFDAVNHANGIAALDARIGAGVMGPSWAGSKKEGEQIPETFLADFVRIYEYPTENDPEVKWLGEGGELIVKENESFTLEAEALPSKKTGSPIQCAYLFDSGQIIDYKTQPPYAFTVTINEVYYGNSNYVRAGRSGVKSSIYGLHAYAVLVQDADGRVANTRAILKLPEERGKSSPYQGKAQTIPGILNPSLYDEGGNGIAYYDDNKNIFSDTFRPGEGVDTKGSGVIGQIYTGEWINMTVDIAKSGKYKALLNFGTPNHGDNQVVMFVDNKQVGTFNLFPHGFEHWGVISKTTLENIDLPEGRHVIKLLMIGGFNVGKLEFIAQTQTEE